MNRAILILMPIFLSAGLSATGCAEPQEKEVVGLVAKSAWQGKKEMTEKLLEMKKNWGMRPFWPRFLLIDGKYLYTTDTHHRIQTFQIDTDGSLNIKFTEKGRGDSLRGFNIDFLAIRDNYLFVSDLDNHRIQSFKINSDGSLVPKFSIGKQGGGAGEFNSPGSLIIKDSYLFVSDSDNNRIQALKINPDGSLISGSTFDKIKSLVMIEGFLYGIDDFQIQVLEIDSDDNVSLRSTFGKYGKEVGEFRAPNVLAIKDKYLYVSDTGNHRIQVLKINPDGSLTAAFAFGKEGDKLGEFFLPVDLAVKDNYLYVSDMGNDRIQVLEIIYGEAKK